MIKLADKSRIAVLLLNGFLTHMHQRSISRAATRFAKFPASDMVAVMRLIGIRSLRRFAFVVLIPTVVLLGAGCSTFNREWRKAGRNSDPASGLEGRWEGQWLSDVNRHHGKLRCIVTKGGEGYQARFHAKYQTILSFGYTVPLKVSPTENGYKFDGNADLGPLAGGIYHYDGHADATNFFSTYSCKYDHGKFQMQRQ